MSTGKILRRLYRQSKGLMALTVLVAVFALLILVYTIVFAVPVGFMFFTRGLALGSFPLTVSMLFLSYEFLGKTKSAHLSEWLETTGGGTQRLFWRQIGTLALLPALITLLYLVAMLISSCLLLRQSEPMWLLNLSGSIVLFFFICPMVTVLLSAAASLWCGRLTAYLFFALFALLNSPIKYTLEERLSFRLSREVPLSFLFCFYPQGAGASPLYQEGQPLPETQLIGITCWLLLAVFLIALHFGLRQPRHRGGNLGAAAAAVVLLLSLTGYNTLPYSNYNRDTFAGALQIIADYVNDSTLYTPPDEQLDDFSVTDCALELKAGRYLRGKAELTVSPENLSVYGFTLHHDYTVQTVTDKEGQALSFARQGDFLTVETTDAKKGIVISYSGANDTFYTTRHSLFLPGYFPYYPMAGYHAFFDTVTGNNISPCIQTEEIAFTVHISGSGKVYSNLPQTETGVFQGKATGVSFLGGLLTSRDIDGIELVYPYLDNTFQQTEQIDGAVEAMLALGLNPDDCERIMIMPNCNIRGIQRQYMLDLGDHLLALDLNDAENDYQKSKILPYKVPLYENCYIYRTSPNTFERMASFAEDDSNAAYLLKIAIQEKGESAALAACEAFLYNRDDTRTIQAFFADFMREG